MYTPFFSIIIPVYNTPVAYLSKCIESVIIQTCKEYEIILVDDGSNKDISDLCDSYSYKNERIKVIHQKNQGVSVARNNGIKYASGKWILFIDADDYLERNACELLLKQLKGVDCDILMFNGVREYAGKQMPMNYGMEDGRLYDMNSVSDKELLYKRAMGVPDVGKGWSCIITYAWDKVYSKDFLISSGVRFPEKLPKSEDKVFILSCFEKMERFLYYEKVLYHYRMNDSSICNRYSYDADKYRKELVERLSEIANRMDAEIGLLIKKSDYSGITQEFERYTFGLISDVLLLKYFHKDNPDNIIARHRGAVQFISTEPFAGSIRKVRYSELSNDAKIKKGLLSLKLVGTFCFMKKVMNTIKGKNVESE